MDNGGEVYHVEGKASAKALRWARVWTATVTGAEVGEMERGRSGRLWGSNELR